MTNADTVTELRFEPPDLGFYELDPVHFPRPVTRYWSEVHPAAFKRGTGDFARFYGMLIDSLQMVYINGFAYKIVQPVADDDVPARFQRASEVIQGKLWREQLREWDETVKPNSIKAHRELQAVDPDQLSDDQLVAHLTRCRDHHAAMIAQHMRFTASAVVPTGDFLAHVGDWTGLPPSQLLGLMQGSPQTPGRRLCSSRMATPARCCRRCARSTASPVRPCPSTSTWSGTGCWTGSTSRGPTRSSCRTC